MVAPGVALVMVTSCAEAWTPAAGEKTGAPALSLYVAEATALSFIPGAAARALMVVLVPTVTGPVAVGELAVGVVPSVVKWMLAPEVAQAMVTSWAVA
jgi:hypothetical protein